MAELQVFDGDLPFSAISVIRGAEIMAMDIETDTSVNGLDWKVSRTATVQVYVPERDFLGLVRVQPDVRPSWLCALLWDRSSTKIFHYAMFDLRFMIHDWDVYPENVVCTRVGAKMLGFDPGSCSLKAQVKNYLGVDMKKGQALTDWTAETLTPEQLKYAAEDVLHLPRLYQKQRFDIRQHGKLHLYEAVCGFIPTYAWLEVHGDRPGRYFER